MSIAFARWREVDRNCSNSWQIPFQLVVVLYCIVSITTSANCGSFYKCANFIARYLFSVKCELISPFSQHAHFVISAIQFSKCISLFAMPALVGVLVGYDTDVQGWNTIFIGFGVVLILERSLFRVFSGE